MPRRTRILLFLLLSLFAAAPTKEGRGADVYDQERCSICHVRRSVFFDPRFLPQGREKEFGEERVCFSCHNGTIRDDRNLLWRGAQHPAAGGEARRCSRCHNPHTKGGWGVLAGSSIPLASGGEAICTGCHTGYSNRPGAIHRKKGPPTGCRDCHRAHGGVGKALLKVNREALCFRCHATETFAGKGGHPVATGEGTGQTRTGRKLPECQACHPVHPGNGTERPEKALCEGCHTQQARGRNGGARLHAGGEDCLSCHSFHGPAGEGGRALRGKDIRADILCGRCHAAYRAESSARARERGMHVTIQAGKGNRDICFRCHSIHKSVPGTPLLNSKKAYSCFECHEEQNTISETKGIALAHPVFERIPKSRLARATKEHKLLLGTRGEIVCRTCHTVHGAAKNTPLLTPGAAEGLCRWCHEDAGAKEHAARGKTGAGCGVCHPVHGRKNLGPDPWKAVCSECHPRASMHPLGLEDRYINRPQGFPSFDSRGRAVPLGSISCPTCHESHGKPRIARRLRQEYSVSGFLCTSCHANRENVALTPHDMRGIAGNGICEPCHLPHGGTAPYMWGVAGDNAAGSSSDTCGACHRAKGLGSAVVDSHPLNMIPDRPLPSIYPLFGGKTGAETAGLFNCSTCHDVHGAGLQPGVQGMRNLLRAFAARTWPEPERNWECAPCHQEVVAHAKLGCASCHPPHRKDDGSRTRCNDCHKKEPKGLSETHGDDGEGCPKCHRIHVRKGRKPETIESRCMACHPKTERIRETSHAEMEGGICGTCHPAHRELDPVNVRRVAGEEVFPPNLSCHRCHRDDGVASVPKWIEHPTRKKKVPTNYGGMVTLETAIAMSGGMQEGGKPVFPLFGEDGRPDIGGRLGCLTCHDPHRGQIRVASGKGPSASGYLRDPSDAFLAEICAPCHRENPMEHARKFHTIPRSEE